MELFVDYEPLISDEYFVCNKMFTLIFFFSSNTTPTSPLLEEAGCGLLNALGSSSSPTFSSSLKLLVGSRHHFDLVSIDLSQNGNSDSTRILTLASGSSTGAISATEVSKFTWYYTSKY